MVAQARHVLGIFHLKQVELGRAKSVVTFSHGKEAAVRPLSPGDRVIYCAPRVEPGGGSVQAFVAHATVTGEAPFQMELFGGRAGWVREAAYDEVAPADVRPLLGQLSFVPDARHWGMAFRGGWRSLSGADYGVIRQALFGHV